MTSSSTTPTTPMTNVAEPPEMAVASSLASSKQSALCASGGGGDNTSGGLAKATAAATDFANTTTTAVTSIMGSDKKSGSSTTTLLPAVNCANVMGRYLKLIPDQEPEQDGTNNNTNNNSTFNFWKGSGIVADWPGVTLTFRNVTNTKTIKIRMRGGLSVFGYRVVRMDNNTDNDHNDEHEEDNDQILNTYGFWGLNGNTERDYEIAKDLDPSSSYRVQIWKRDDPGRGIIKIVGLVVDKGGTADQRIDTSSSPKRKIIEFVGDADTLGFLNMSETTTRRMSALFLSPILSLGGPRMRKATDVTKAWPVLVAKELNRQSSDGVDWQICAKTEICAGRYREEDPSMTEVYPFSLYDEWRVSQGDEDKEGRNLKPVDAVCVYIGQEDQGALGGRFLKNTESLVAGFVALLHKIRQVRGGDVPVIVIVPTWDCVLSRIGSEKGRAFTASSQNDLWKEAVQKMGGADKNFFVVENQHEPQIKLGGSDDFALMLQWNSSSHEKFASGLVEKLKPLLGFSWKDSA